MNLRQTLETKLFPHVMKPGRYAGGESGQIVKDPASRTSYLHAFPDKYELGQSYLGLQSLYHIVNSDDRFLFERAFAVDLDAEEIMRREQIPLFSLESSRPARDFDAIGFTVTYELVYTSMLAMLDLAGIPLESKQRTDSDPIIMAGGPAVYNPEPLAAFIDLIFVGDAEEGLPQILAILHKMKDASRIEKLHALSTIESVYIPQFYDESGTPLKKNIPEQIKARVIPSLKPEYYPGNPIVPLIETVHSHLGIEIMRGCPRGCRFCQAGPMYRPVRVRPQNDILRQIETQVLATGYDEIGLVSLSSTDYPEIDDLARTVSQRLEKNRVSISLSSLRPGSISPTLLKAVSTVRKSGLTLAPEAGTERLRLFLRKDFPDSAVYDSIRIAFDNGWTTIKLYFMVGLPTETDDDLYGIVDMISNIYDIGREYPSRKTINVTLSPFVPKPHTPLQWDAICPPEEVLRKVQLVRRNNRIKAVNFKYHSTESSVLAGLLGRGGREMSAVIESAFRRGCRFDGWSENFKPDIWFEEFKNHHINIEDKMQPIPFSTRLPWAHIQKGVSVAHLQKERHRSSVQLKEFTPRFVSSTEESGSRQPQFGRQPKKIIGKTTTAAPTKSQLRIQWGKTGQFKYMSHLDNVRTLERAIRMSKIPVAYSQGFNPSMRMSFGPPLPLGFTSETEFADIIFDTSVMPYMVENLKMAMPTGFDILAAATVFAKKRSLSALLNRARYTVPLNFLGDTVQLQEEIQKLLSEPEHIVERVRAEKTKIVDIRPAIYDLQVVEDNLIMSLGVGDGGFTRPTEVVSVLTGMTNKESTGLSYHRKALYRQDEDGQIRSGMDL